MLLKKTASRLCYEQTMIWRECIRVGRDINYSTLIIQNKIPLLLIFTSVEGIIQKQSLAPNKVN